MENMTVEQAQYIRDEILATNVGINAVIDGVFMGIPLDPANRHYAEIMRQVEAGTLVIAEAE